MLCGLLARFVLDGGRTHPDDHSAIRPGWIRVAFVAAHEGMAVPLDRGNVQDFETIGTVAVSGACAGDCGGNGEVTVEEVITAVNIALDVVSLAACRSIDANGDGAVEVNELVRAINRALGGCAAPERDAPLVSHLWSSFASA